MQHLKRVLIGSTLALSMMGSALVGGGGASASSPVECVYLYNPDTGNFVVFVENYKTETTSSYSTNRPPRNCYFDGFIY